MLIGYARVSTLDQNPQLQIDALNEAGLQAAQNNGRIAGRPLIIKTKKIIRLFRSH